MGRRQELSCCSAERSRWSLYIGLRIVTALFGAALLLNGWLHAMLWPEQGAVSTLSSFAAAIILAVPVFARALSSLWRGEAEGSSEQLVSVAILASLATGEFVTAALVPMLMTVGHFLEERSILGTREAIEGIARIVVERATRLGAEGQEEDVPSSALVPGDRMLLRPGDGVPADGTVVEGASALDTSSITGEPVPRDAGPGDEVFAGTVNLSGRLVVEVSRTGGETTLGKVRELMKEAEASKTPVMRLVEGYVHWYLPLILMVAAATYVYTRDVQRSISMLIVACPCAFVLAGPAAMVASLATASRLGILVKNTRFLEVAAELDAMVFDKTGTLTTGGLTLRAVQRAAGVEEAALAPALALAAASRHPVSQALAVSRRDGAEDLPPLVELEERPGRGLAARVDGVPCLLGSAAFLAEEGVRDLPDGGGEDVEVHFARDGRWMARFLISDLPRPEAADALRRLRALGVEHLSMVTGDREAVARAVAAGLGLEEVHAACLPAGKLERVEAVKAAGRKVAVVGDGINDTLALAAGDLGIAMGAMGSDIALKASDVALMTNDLSRLPLLVALARSTRSTIHANLAFGALFSICAMTLSALAIVGPLGAALLHNGGAIFVVFNSARLLRFSASSPSA